MIITRNQNQYQYFYQRKQMQDQQCDEPTQVNVNVRVVIPTCLQSIERQRLKDNRPKVKPNNSSQKPFIVFRMFSESSTCELNSIKPCNVKIILGWIQCTLVMSEEKSNNVYVTFTPLN